MEITNIIPRKVLDSRGRWTLELDLVSKKNKYTASVPAGKSRGKYEAKQYDIEKTLRFFPEFKKQLVGKTYSSQDELDDFLIRISGDKKQNYGVDLSLATSIAYSRSKKVKPRGLPTPMFNVINGGLHAGGDLKIQEFMVVPHKLDSYSEKLNAGVSIYHHLREKLEEKYGKSAVNVGDEGGFAPPIKETHDVLELLEIVIGELGLLEKVSISLDCAASSYFEGGKYLIDNKKFSPAEYVDYLSNLASSFHVFSVEDPLEETDFNGFAQFLKGSHSKVVGDDLTVTNVSRLEKAYEHKSINALLVKPNQIGTITETLKAIDYCKKVGWTWIISHRSGETIDSFIADFASGTASPFIKAGAPARGERTAKYNQLLRLEGLL
ncbi:MAG: phosphopyruvate hydratase [Candidatus Altiarchaeota archaeon]|nr:phosphopyruvate hydratase [Candidatus Altiarchaeota archaeon]